MLEKNFQSLFTKYIKSHPQPRSAVFELKICKLPSLAFNRLEEHQKTALLEATLGEGHQTYLKISDQSMGQKPFDAFVVTGVDAFVVLLFYKPRQKKEAILINIRSWVKEEETCGRKSIPEARAKEIAYKIIEL